MEASEYLVAKLYITARKSNRCHMYNICTKEKTP